ncbi:MAG: 23S rRNA (pseudouridine(1915)-N(3))-methyltransferase RlmH [Firmicutes bacterium HGW-Firmicutes-13]|nr:MAG: 23S rRNA (pseudouridine(1915)-N(3))-methyltransferase RlmH [Firmicutes bacterium HGW-Firmicutes-13]
MNLKIIAVGKIREKYLSRGIEEYLKRLRPYARIEIIEVADEKIPDRASPAEEEVIKTKEGERVLKKLEPDSFLVVLAVEGKLLSSEELAGRLEKLAVEGQGKVTFIIGGTLGLAEDIKSRADLLLSFSTLTFPHQVMRFILLEQLYRAFKIIRGEPYHK